MAISPCRVGYSFANLFWACFKTPTPRNPDKKYVDFPMLLLGVLVLRQGSTISVVRSRPTRGRPACGYPQGGLRNSPIELHTAGLLPSAVANFQDTRRPETNVILSIVFDIPTRRSAPLAKYHPVGARIAGTKSDTAAYPLGGVFASAALYLCIRANPYAVGSLSVSGSLFPH